MSDSGMSSMCLPSCLCTSEPSSNSSECGSSVKKIDTVLIKKENEEEQITQTLYTPIENNSACMYHHQRNPPNYMDAVYQNRNCSYPNQQNMPVYSNMNSPHYTNRVQHANGVVKRKRIRTAFTTNQLQDLEEQYRVNRYLERGTRMLLSRKLNVSERIIKIWFQNRRMKEKKDRAECQIVDSCSQPTQSSSNTQDSYVPLVSTCNILPQAINNSGIMNCDNFMYEPNQSVNFGVATMMAEHVLIPRVLEPPTAIEAMPFDRYSNSMPPPYVSEVSSTVFSEFSQYCDAYNAE